MGWGRYVGKSDLNPSNLLNREYFWAFKQTEAQKLKQKMFLKVVLAQNKC